MISGKDKEIAASQTSLAAAEDRQNLEVMIEYAHRWPRDVRKCVDDMIAMATADDDTAMDVFYRMERKDKKKRKNSKTGAWEEYETIKVISGPSVRMAEIAISCWGSTRSAARSLGLQGNVVKAQAYVQDLEKLNSAAWEVDRRATTKSGNLFSEDMQIVTANAAAAIAYRNAVFKVIPKVWIDKAVDAAKRKINSAKPTKERLERVFQRFDKMGVKGHQLLDWLGVDSIEYVGADMLERLIGLGTAIKDGDTTIEAEFGTAQPAEPQDQEQPQEQPPAQEVPKATSDEFSKLISMMEAAKIEEGEMLSTLASKKIIKDVDIHQGIQSIPPKIIKVIIDQFDAIAQMIEEGRE
jgi:hypothetical protein